MNRLRELREEAVLTVRELSELSGVSEDTITKIENDHRKKARPNTIRKLAKALDVAPKELVTKTVQVEATLYWRVLEAAEGGRELKPDERRQAHEVLS